MSEADQLDSQLREHILGPLPPHESFPSLLSANILSSPTHAGVLGLFMALGFGVWVVGEGGGQAYGEQAAEQVRILCPFLPLKKQAAKHKFMLAQPGSEVDVG